MMARIAGELGVRFSLGEEVQEVLFDGRGAVAGTPFQLHLAFKWDVADNTRHVVSRYVWHPHVSVQGILERLAEVYRGHCPESCELARAIVNQAATMRWRSVGEWSVPVVFRAPYGAVHGGGIYHSQSPEAPYCHTPGLKVVAPATPSDAKGLLKAAIRDDDPVIFCEHIQLYNVKGPVPEENYAIPLGKAQVMRKCRISHEASVVQFPFFVNGFVLRQKRESQTISPYNPDNGVT